MLRVLLNQNVLLIYSKHFLYFEWKLEELDFKNGNVLLSDKFNLGDEDEPNSFLKFEVTNEFLYLNLHNPKPLGNGYYVLTILDKTNSIIKSITESTDSFATSGKVDLLESYGQLPSATKYPIKITCTIKSSINDHFYTPCVNYEKRMSEFSTDWMKVLEQGLNTDIELITDGESIKAHRIVLQAHSAVFLKMFEHDSSEASKNTVVISDVGSETVKKLVNFLYTGMMDKCEFDEAMELYYAADKYEVISLREDCKIGLLKQLTVSNACRLFTLANRHNDDDLKEMCKEDVILLTCLCATTGIKQ